MKNIYYYYQFRSVFCALLNQNIIENTNDVSGMYKCTQNVTKFQIVCCEHRWVRMKKEASENGDEIILTDLFIIYLYKC